MKSIIKLIIVMTLIIFGYNWLTEENEVVKALEYKLTTTSIRKVVENPRNYNQATVSGKVKTSINILGVAYYSIQDVENPDFELWVKPKSHSVPVEGSLQKVSGNIKQQFKIAGLQVVCLEEK